jgi:8-oxo-dGTP diphosphatase
MAEYLQAMKKPRPNARVIIIQDNQIALLERHKQGEHYFVFPGGGIDPGETLEQAAVREAREETGLDVVLDRLVAEVTFRGSPQYFYLAHPVGGVIGSGDGPEMSQPPSAKSGSYLARWITIDELSTLRVLPAAIAELALQHPSWPREVVHFQE